MKNILIALLSTLMLTTLAQAAPQAPSCEAQTPFISTVTTTASSCTFMQSTIYRSKMKFEWKFSPLYSWTQVDSDLVSDLETISCKETQCTFDTTKLAAGTYFVAVRALDVEKNIGRSTKWSNEVACRAF